MCNVWCSSDLFDGFYNATGFFFFLQSPLTLPSHTQNCFITSPLTSWKRKKGICVQWNLYQKKKDQIIAEEIYLINKLSKDTGTPAGMSTRSQGQKRSVLSKGSRAAWSDGMLKGEKGWQSTSKEEIFPEESVRVKLFFFSWMENDLGCRLLQWQNSLLASKHWPDRLSSLFANPHTGFEHHYKQS